ncbi:hypothetical protein ACNG34_002684 [Enterococcus faecium]|nr:hypothetical protein [Enterococcus faecium]HCC6683703.1 hypothetical protein [Enterococcus faecium]
MKHYLFDSRQNKYLARLENSKEGYFLTHEKEKAYRFSEDEIDLAWHTAYKCAWLGIGQFFVYGE